MNEQPRSYDFLRSKRIDISDDDELRFWMREFGASPEELYVALKAVGSSARFVGEYLADTKSSLSISDIPQSS